MNLGIVDLADPIDRQVAAMSAACEESGFFRIPLSSVPVDVADQAWSTASEFFALPEREKRQIAFPEPGYPYGYSHFGHETLARSLDDQVARPDMKESLSVGPDCGAHVTAGEDEVWIRSRSLWPTQIPGLRPAWEEYYRALTDVAERLLAVMAQALELPADFFVSLIDRPITSMRAIHYPAVLDPADGALRAGAHADYGTLTILRTGKVPGLQVQRPDGTWADVEPDPGFFVVNLGDSIAQWTNNRWRSTLHRVVPSPTPRQSFAFFHMANWDATIECLPTCLRPGEEPTHPPVQAGPWLMRKFQSTVM